MRTILLAVLTVICISCSSTKTTTDQAMESHVKQWAMDQQFTIESDWAIPLGSSQINLIGNPNFLTVKNDTVSAYLPFFGERHSGNSLDGGGIEFEGVPKNYQMIYNQKKNSSTIKFTISEKSEQFDVTLILYDNQNANITVNSSQRDVMRYQGTVEALQEDEK